MPRRQCQSLARLVDFHKFSNHASRDRRSGSARRRRAAFLPLLNNQLEIRQLLSGSAMIATAPLTTLNLQLQNDSGATLAKLTPLLASEGASVEATTIPGLYQVQVPSANQGTLAQQLSARSGVAYIASQQTVNILTVPNDPSYTNGSEWQLSGAWGINAPTAWNTTTGSDKVIVANVDTGIAYNQPDLYNNIWLNQAEIPSSVMPNLTDVYKNGVITFTDLNNPVNQGPGKIVDTNGDGIITATDVLAPTSSGGWASGSTQDGDTSHPSDLVGWNFVNNNNNPLDQNGHGTFTAGEIGAVGNNGVGVTGVDWNVQIMPVLFLDSSGSGTDTAAAEAIDYAVNHGAKVINASWGGSGWDSTIASAVQYADQNGVIIVAAAGNSGTNDTTTPFSPASYSATYPNLIAVAATDSNGKLASWSNYGVGTVQLAAPGVNVYSTTTSGYGYLSGTSMAAPMVTGTIALVEAAHPTWSMQQVIDAVLDHTTPDPSLSGFVATGGIVNAAAAVDNTIGPHITSASLSGAVTGVSSLSTLTVTFNEEVNPATFTPSQVALTGPAGTVSGISVAAVTGSNDHQFTISFPSQTAPGTYTLKVGPDIQDWYGNAMNQNGNLINGEASDAFTDTMYLSATGSPDLLSVTSFPTSTTAGTAETITITALSPDGSANTSYRGTVRFTSSDPKATLPANYVFTSSDQGTHSFTAAASLVTQGAQSITVTDTANSSIVGAEENIWVTGATAHSLVIGGLPSSETSGTPFDFTVTAVDQYGNVASGYSGTVAFTSTDSEALLPSTYSYLAGNEGTASFSATLRTDGNQTITASDTATGNSHGQRDDQHYRFDLSGPVPRHIQRERPEFRLVFRRRFMAGEQRNPQPDQHRHRRPQESHDHQPDVPCQRHDHRRGRRQFLDRGRFRPGRGRTGHQHEQREGLQSRLSQYQPGSVPQRRTRLGQRLYVQLAGGYLVLVPARRKQRHPGRQGLGGRYRRAASLDVPADRMDQPYAPGPRRSTAVPPARPAAAPPSPSPRCR